MFIGAHAVLFKEKIAQDTTEILTELSSAGYQGVEIGARFFQAENLAQLKEKLEKTNVKLAGLHNSIPLLGLLDNREEVANNILGLSEQMQKNGFDRMILTGMPIQLSSLESLNDISSKNEIFDRLSNEEEMKQLARNLDEIAKKSLEDYNVELFYHNHFWEFLNDGIIFNALIEHAPSLTIALDIGWAAIEGFDIVNLIKENSKRIGHLHLRDCLTHGVDLKSMTAAQKSMAFIDVGEGDINFIEILNAFEESSYTGDKWAIVEYETGETSYERYKKAKEILTK